MRFLDALAVVLRVVAAVLAVVLLVYFLLSEGFHVLP